MKLLASESFPLKGQHLIEASAGTGKTYTITNLYLRLLLGQAEEHERPFVTSEILVLTFTIAATDELRQRIRDRIIYARNAFARQSETTDPTASLVIDETQADAPDDFIQHLIETSLDKQRDRKLLSAALQTMDEAAIYTIHGFCARVLSEQSFETGTLFNQNLDADRDLLLQHATEDIYRGLILKLDEYQRNIALALWPTPEALLQQISPFLFRHKLTMRPQQRDINQELSQVLADIQKIKKIWLEENLSEVIRNSGFHGGRTTVRRLDMLQEYCASESLDIETWQPWSEAGLAKATIKKTVPPDHRIFALIESIWQRKPVVDQVKYNLWHQVIHAAREHLGKYKHQFSQLTLDDLLTHVHAALQTPDSQLANQLRLRWPIAMIDEFQDTDDIQYEIFSAIYPDKINHSLFYIGDPKQAIYQFRGADIYTYINAKRSLDLLPENIVFSLTTNWRSTQALVSAVNQLFTQPGIFGDDNDIPFSPAQSAEANRLEADRKSLEVSAQVAKPVSLFYLDEDTLKKDQVRRLAIGHAAEQTAQLLTQAQQGSANIDGQPLRAGQIAFLVRDRKDAREARKALQARNINSVYVTLESVLLSDTADDLKLILQAVLEPTNERKLKAALACRLMLSNVSEIDAISHHVETQQQVLEEFQHYHHLWETVDVAPMIESFITRRHIAQKWFRQPDGERQITNLRHLSELLQQRSAVAPGMFRLIKWFSHEQSSAETVASEDAQLRLESDHNLVQIVTIHASKGLEYDVVFIPMAGFSARRPGKSEPVLIHQTISSGPATGQFESILDFAASDELRNTAYQERLAEDMRLLYVAITRARYKIYLGVPLSKTLGQSALGHLLKMQDMKKTPEMIQQLAQLPDELFEITAARAADQMTQTRYQAEEQAPDLSPPAALPTITDRWRVHSYTGLTRLIQTEKNPTSANHTQIDAIPGFGDDDSGLTLTGNHSQKAVSRFTFPRGPRVGVALHDLFEHLDFNADDAAIEVAGLRLFDQIALTDEDGNWLAMLTQWIRDILDTEMAGAMTNASSQQAGFALKQITPNKRLNELEFHFPVKVTNEFLHVLQQAGYLEPESTLSINSLSGMMTGFIDLIVESDQKYYLVDYKSNDLGPSQESYSTTSLNHAVTHHQYDLQYLIYCVALNRYLKRCLPEYHYSKNFGGVCYLFLRGMSGQANAGIHYDLPDAQLIEQLDDLLDPKT